MDIDLKELEDLTKEDVEVSQPKESQTLPTQDSTIAQSTTTITTSNAGKEGVENEKNGVNSLAEQSNK